MSAAGWGLPPYDDNIPEPLSPEDQVPRMKAYRERNPDVTIVPPGPLSSDYWWLAFRGKQRIAKRIELQWLLDDLEKAEDSDGT